uniref:Uncharacterized protein n=1 Tax=Heliothis virescens TaxID=7102 RepID=A0A2A4J3T5_HELVI
MSVSSVITIYSYSISGEDSDSSGDKTSNPGTTERFSSFGDSACGEPLQAQHITVDFTPDDTVDNEIVEDKICSFWKFIKDNPHIKKFKVQPEKNSYSRPSTTVKAEESPREPEYNDEVVGITKGAVSMLEVAEKKGLITSMFEKTTQRTLHSEYKENDPGLQNIRKRRKEEEPVTTVGAIRPKRRQKRGSKVCKCVNICKPCREHPKPMSEARLLCNTLTEWDAKHPKSMKAPAQPPLLHHCIIQPQVYP